MRWKRRSGAAATASPTAELGEPVPSFFTAYPRFLATSDTSAELDRLDLRYHAIFAENRAALEGARVLDIASHDGRWSLAALATGATQVTGIEAREHLVDSARATLAGYGFGPERARFVHGDVFEVLAREQPAVDVVLCLGYLYHTLRFTELLRRIRDLAPRWLIVDTAVSRAGAGSPMVRLVSEPVEREGNAVLDPWSWGDRTLVGWPNVRGLRYLLETYDFEVDHRTKWRPLIRANPGRTGVDDYANRQRVTIRARLRT